MARLRPVASPCMRLKTHIRIVGLVAIGGLVIGLALLLRAELGLLREAREVVRSFEGLHALSELVHELQRERGLAGMSVDVADAQGPVVGQYPRTDAAQRAALDAGAIGEDELAPLRMQRRHWSTSGSDPLAVRGYYTAAIDRLLGRVAEQARDTGDATLRKALLAQSELLRTKETLGSLRALGARGLAQGEPRQALAARAREQLAVVEATAARSLETAHAADPVQAGRVDAVLVGPAFGDVREAVDALGRAPAGADLDAAQAWFDTVAAAMDHLQRAGDQGMAAARERADAVAREATAGLIARVLLVVAGWIGSCWIVLASLRRLMLTVDRLGRETRALLARLDAGDTDAGDLHGGFMHLVERVEHLSTQASTDPLTRALNRRGFEPLAHAELLRAQRHARPLAILLLDIDHFKRINDEHGHAAGDTALREVALLVRRTMRAEDLFARWGGEEFVVLAPETDEAAAAQLADKLRRALEQHDFGRPRRLTASFGVAQASTGDDLGRLFDRADAALYRAKAGGRNRVCRASDAPAAAEGLRLVHG